METESDQLLPRRMASGGKCQERRRRHFHQHFDNPPIGPARPSADQLQSARPSRSG